LVFLRWPPRSPNLTPWDFFLWGYVKGRVYVPQLPTNLPELRRRIVAAVATIITPDMLTRVWEEFDYRVDVCHVTNGAHIEHLWFVLWNLVELLFHPIYSLLFYTAGKRN
jgi:hypothetical protein